MTPSEALSLIAERNKVLAFEVVMLKAQLQQMQGINIALNKEARELKETIVKQSQEIAKLEISEIEKSWNKEASK